MSVTMEISIPDFVKSKVDNQTDPSFTKPFESAVKKYGNAQKIDFIDLFVNEFNRVNEGTTDLSAIIGGVSDNSSDDQVKVYLRKELVGAIDGVETVMNKRINQFGVAQPNIQIDKANNRIYIELPGVQDDRTVAEKLQATANLEFFELYSNAEILDFWGQADELSKRGEGEQIDLDTNSLPSAKNSSKGLKSLVLNNPHETTCIGYAKNDSDKAKVSALLSRKDIKSLMMQNADITRDGQVRFMWSEKNKHTYRYKGSPSKTINGWLLYACKVPVNGKAKVGGDDIKSAKQSNDQQNQNEPVVDLTMSDEGSSKWEELTRANVGKPVAITMDNIVFSAPVVRGVMSDNSQISGNFTIQEALDLAGLLNGGSINAPLVIKRTNQSWTNNR